MTKTHRTKTNERPPVAETTAPDEGRAPGASFEREHQMTDFSIGYDGLHYAYNGYRYDRLADAVAIPMVGLILVVWVIVPLTLRRHSVVPR